MLNCPLKYCTVLLTKHFLPSTSTCASQYCDTLTSCQNAPSVFLLTVMLLWYVVSRSWHFLFNLLCVKSLQTILSMNCYQEHITHTTGWKICPVSLWFVIFVSMHLSLLWALPVPLSSSFPPAISPAVIHQTVSQYSQSRGRKGKTREKSFFLGMQIQRQLNLLFG